MFGPFGWAFEFLQIKRITSDNYVFQLFYKHTIAIHVAFVVILGWSQYFGKAQFSHFQTIVETTFNVMKQGCEKYKNFTY